MQNNTAYEKHYRRLALEGIIKSGIYALIVGFFVSMIVAAISYFIKVNLIYLSLILFFACIYAAMPLFYFIKFKPSPEQVAKRLDALGLSERVLTATSNDMLAAAADTPQQLGDSSTITTERLQMIAAQQQDTAQHLGILNPKQIKLKIFKLPIALLIIIAILSVSLNIFALVRIDGIPDCAHDYGEWIRLKEATCTQEGLDIRTCTAGFGHTEIRYIPVSDVHDYGEWVTTVYAGENTDGEEIRVCKNNSSHTQIRTIFPVGTAGLSFSAINNGNEYSVSLGSAAATDIVIPDTIHGNPITVVADMGFYNSNIQSITLGKNITLIENLAFGRCTRLTNIEIPSATIEIGMWAFYACENLTEVSFKSGSLLKTIGYRAFLECESLKSFENSSVTYLAEESFKACYNLKKVVVPNSLIYRQ